MCQIYSDSFVYNSFNNHGSIGLVNMPNARFYNESSFGVTLYDGTPDQRITVTSFPYDWMEASFFYMNLKDNEICRTDQFDNTFCQGYKDKGFNFKIRIKEEGLLPAIAIGINDIAGTGFYSSEYLVASYGVNKTDFHFGLGWGNLNGSDKNFKNPLGYLSDSFYERPTFLEGQNDQGGQFEPSRYFSDDSVSPFFGITHVFKKNLIMKVEYDTTKTPGKIGFEKPEEDFSLGFEYNVNENFSFGVSTERGNYTSLKFTYKNNPKSSKPKFEYKKVNSTYKGEDKYKSFIRNVRNNGITVNKIIENEENLGIEFTQFIHPNLDVVEEIIRRASIDSGLDKEIKKDLRIADLQVISEFDEEFEKNSLTIYERNRKQKFASKNSINFRPFIASREAFLKGAILIENNSEYVIRDNLFFTSNLKYSLVENFDDLTLPPENTFPAQVRSDVKDYLRNFGDGIFIGRAQIDYHITPKKNHHFMFSGGILEEMFNGVGFEYLYFKPATNYALGFEIFDVKKRDYEMRFGALDYGNITGHFNFYYRNYETIPFDAKISLGEYLAGDTGITFEISRSFKNGTKFGVFASFTDVSSEEFGEGSFDKGLFFNVPVFGNFINYSWRPLTKDPGAKLIRKNTLYDLLVRFRPIN